MKKYFAFLFAVIIFLFTVVPAFAYDWPPENYEMPRTVLTADTMKNSLAGLIASIRSIADTGLNIIGVLLPIFIILPLFDKLFFKNLKSTKGILGKGSLSNTSQLEINNSLRKNFQVIRPDDELEEGLYLKQASYSAKVDLGDRSDEKK